MASPPNPQWKIKIWFFWVWYKYSKDNLEKLSQYENKCKKKRESSLSRKNTFSYLKITWGVVVTFEDDSSTTSTSTGIGNSSPTRKAVPVGK